MSAQKHFVNIGDRFNRLVVVAQGGLSSNRRRLWVCHCDCGNEATAFAAELHKGQTKSCGCWKRDRMTAIQREAAANSIRRKDGKATLTYAIWCHMKSRCNNPKNPRFDRYGGRGIRVCDQWVNSFECFLADMGECPPGLSIERDDNDGNYQPGNCRWATDLEQGRNNSRVRLTDEVRSEIARRRGAGESQTEVAAALGIHQTTVSDFERGRTWVGALLGRNSSEAVR